MELGYLNYNNVKELDKPIYRVFTIQRLLEAFEEEKLTLVRPSLWDDPFENYLMKAQGKMEDGNTISISFRNDFYGQCWTKTIESDALWRIYAPEKNGVKVKTTPRKLLTALLTQNPQPHNINLTCFIGNVAYYKRDELKGFFDILPSMLTDSTGAGQAKTLLLKRNQFQHENEVRVIYNSLGTIDSNIYKFSINPLDLFDKIVFDPRMDDLMYNIFKKHLEEKGYNKGIIKSSLYKEPHHIFKF